MTAAITKAPRHAASIFLPGDGGRLAIASAIVAALDLSFVATWFVVLRHQTTVPRILRSISVGLLGRGALDGGTRTALIGLVLHCVVATGWSLIFLLCARRWAAFADVLNSQGGAAKVGAPFGMFVWLAMTFVVIPLSHARPASPASSWFWICLAWHAVGVGLPMALIFRTRGVMR